jgi:RIO kinase 1
MRIPESLSSLVDAGIIEEVLRPLMSGKEAQIYLVRSAGERRVAKVYKAAQDRSFRQRAEYTEGRTVRNSRDQRAQSKRTRHGREQDEIAWRATEVDMIYRLHAAGVRVPTPFHFIDGVLIMELIVDSDGDPAPRLGDLDFDRESASEIYDQLLRYVVQMLCADVVHGDLSGFNVLMAADGPVIIDFPQAVNAAGNQNARKLLLRDVDNLHHFLARFAPEKRRLPYAEEMWQLYQRGELTPEVPLTGRYRAAETKVDTSLVLDLIADAEQDERRRRSSKGLGMRGMSDSTSERRPDPRSAHPTRAHNPAEQRRHKPDTRQPFPAGPETAVQQRQRLSDSRQPQPARAHTPVDNRRRKPDPRKSQPARAQNPVEYRRPKRDLQPAPATDVVNQPQRDSRKPQPSHARNVSQSRGPTPAVDPARTPSTPPLRAAVAKRPPPRRD